MRTQREGTVCEPGGQSSLDTKSALARISDIQTPGLWGEKKAVVSHPPPNLQTFIKAAQTKTKNDAARWPHLQAFHTLNELPGGSVRKESACNAGDPSLIPGSGRAPAGGNGNPLQISHLENPMDRGAWWAVVQGVAKSWTRLSDETTIGDTTTGFSAET